jgi:hypothetical protein
LISLKCKTEGALPRAFELDRLQVNAALYSHKHRGKMTLRVESDRWGPGPNILSPEHLEQLRAALEDTPVIVEHWFYRGSSAPDRHVFDDFEKLEAYLRTRTTPGDDIWAGRFDTLCRNENSLVHGKVPDTDGAVPASAPY